MWLIISIFFGIISLFHKNPDSARLALWLMLIYLGLHYLEDIRDLLKKLVENDDEDEDNPL